MEPVELRTPRLRLSVPVGADADAVYDACQDPDIQRYTTVPSPYTRTHAAAFPVTAARGWEDETDTVWAVRSGDVLAGMVGLHRLGTGSGELGYWLAPAFRGSGVMTEAADAVIFMVKQLRKGTQLDKIQDANAKLQHAEGAADKLMLEFLKDLYNGPYDAKTFVIVREFYEMLEKVIDRCRDAGNVVLQIVLKYS
jgi:hypothetical protein